MGLAALRERIDDPDPQVREHAYMALLARQDDTSRELVWAALRGATESDEDLRQRILASAMNQSVDLPPDLLADLALVDGSEVLRVLALDALADGPRSEDVAVTAASDPSPMVRQRAEEILEAKAANRRKSP